MRIHYLQHVHFEGLGYIETWIKEKDYKISSTCFFEPTYTIPEVKNIDALIILGGPMGVYDDHQYEWLQKEKAFIGDCIAAGKKVLGICLGAQLMAACLGAKVYAAENKEIGWFKVEPTNEGKRVHWLYSLFQNNPEVFHWHGDTFEIPNGSIDLLTSEANNNQAFYHNENLIGLQFHLEVTRETANLMLRNAGDDINEGRYIQSEWQIREGLIQTENCNTIMAEILANWLYPGQDPAGLKGA